MNLLVGANNVGKTSVLEALYLLGNPGDPAASLKLSAARGVDASPRVAEEVWLDLPGEQGIPIQLFGRAAPGPIWVDISLQPADEAAEMLLTQQGDEIGLPELGSRLTTSRSLVQTTVLRREGHQPEVSTAFVDTSGNLSGRSFTSPYWPRTILVPSTGVVDETEVAEGLSQSEESGLVGDLVEDIRSLIPELTDLRVGLRRLDGKAFVRAHLGNGDKRPLHLFGSGAVRLLGILLASSNNRAGVILIDEIDSGIYHDRLNQTWLALAAAARRTGMMVVATTHSQECVEAAVGAFTGQYASDFRLHRLSRRGNGIRHTTMRQRRPRSTSASSSDEDERSEACRKPTPSRRGC